MHISSLSKILHHSIYFFPASTFFWAASCLLDLQSPRLKWKSTYDLSLSGLELLLGSLELFLFPLSDVLTLFSLFSLAVLSA
jgi:hypothetical protein